VDDPDVDPEVDLVEDPEDDPVDDPDVDPEVDRVAVRDVRVDSRVCGDAAACGFLVAVKASRSKVTSASAGAATASPLTKEAGRVCWEAPEVVGAGGVVTAALAGIPIPATRPEDMARTSPPRLIPAARPLTAVDRVDVRVVIGVLARSGARWRPVTRSVTTRASP
jgi:hypothetical protein